jgi:RNA polymerase sigma factor (sigma-70 family)
MKNTKEEFLTDEDLVTKTLNGDKGSFGLLYNRYRDKVYNKCVGMTHDAIIAEDHTQDIMTRALEALDTYRGEASFSTWLYAITYNHCMDYLRKNKRVRFDDWIDLLEIPEEPDEAEVIRLMNLQKERLTLLLELLKPEDKALLVLKYWEGMTLSRIQYILSIKTESALKMKLFRARKHLRAVYNKFHSAVST